MRASIRKQLHLWREGRSPIVKFSGAGSKIFGHDQLLLALWNASALLHFNSTKMSKRRAVLRRISSLTSRSCRTAGGRAQEVFSH
eukprot:6027682-Pyramimonas_sp.AAC.1